MGVIWWGKLGDFRGGLAGVKKIVVACGGARFLEILVCTPTRRGHPFVPTKGCKSGLGLRPKNPTHRNARPENQRAVSRSVG